MSAPEWRRRVPYVGAESGWWADTPAMHFAPAHVAPARQLADRLGIRTDAFDDEVRRLSTGERQRLAIIRALVLDPPVLLLDEPTSSLDPRQREVLWEWVAGLAREGTSVVFTTHNVGEAERWAHRVLVLADGELVFTGTPADLAAAAGDGTADFEGAFVHFLRERGH
jgi:ABC-2 type transport system ATP-binding protein